MKPKVSSLKRPIQFINLKFNEKCTFGCAQFTQNKVVSYYIIWIYENLKSKIFFKEHDFINCLPLPNVGF